MLRTSHRVARRLVTAAAAVLLATTALTAVADSPALAQGCVVPAHRPNGGGELIVDATTTLWTGPYSVCNVIEHVGTSDVLWVWCFMANSYGNEWFYVRVGGTSTYGWVYSGSNPTFHFVPTYVDGELEGTQECS